MITQVSPTKYKAKKYTSWCEEQVSFLAYYINVSRRYFWINPYSGRRSMGSLYNKWYMR